MTRPSEFVCPPALSPGDRVAVLAPCATAGDGTYPDHLVDLGVERLADVFGLEAEVYPSVRTPAAERYADPEGRAAELERAFRDPDVRGVVAAIGGNDQVRVLKHLDPEVFREHPTRFFGTSDNTAFAAFLWGQGVVSFYGGTLFTDVCEPGGMNDYTREHLERALFGDGPGAVAEGSAGDDAGVWRPAERFSDHDRDWNDPANLHRDPEYEASPGRTWAGSEERVTGRAFGGCLAVLDSLAVANRVPDERLDGTVLLVETSEELPAASVVRRHLTALGERGLLGRAGAVLVGRAKARSHREARPPDERAAYRERQRDAVVGVVSEYNPGAPVVLDCEFGHCRPVAPVPVGGRIVVDPAAERLAFAGDRA